jgi:hypothetical protein
MSFWKSIQRTLAALATTATLAVAQATPGAPGEVRQSLDDAWFTGPMLAPNATTLPRGHFLIEPYLYDVIAQGFYDRDGKRHELHARMDSDHSPTSCMGWRINSRLA